LGGLSYGAGGKVFITGCCRYFYYFWIFGIERKIKNSEGNFYSIAGNTAILVAIPLFIINMLFWGFFLTESFTLLVTSGSEKMPEWFTPVRKLFGLISVTEVALTYFATAAFAVAFKKSGFLGKSAAIIYIIISGLAFCSIILSACCPKSFNTAGYAVSIPAIPFIMPYFLGVNVLRRLGN
jgi:hypothetical protein